eukprot:8563694-Heterocapsa_arctica.AAC.1
MVERLTHGLDLLVLPGLALRLGLRLGLGLGASSLALVDELVGSVAELLDAWGRQAALATALAERSLDPP